jgi:glycosyltransferase involved in cell wall biosynthesis
MRVAFNAYLLRGSSSRGWNRYTVNLLARLPAVGITPYLYSTAPIHPDHLARLPPGSFQVRIAPPMHYAVWEQRWVPRQCKIDRVDLFHSPFNYGLPWSTPCLRILTLHDAIAEVYYGPRTPLRAKLTIGHARSALNHWMSRTRANHIITVSEHAKADIVRKLRVPSAKVTVVAEAADPCFVADVSDEVRRRMRSVYALTRPFVFYVGGWEERKNIPFLLDAFARAALADVDLVLAGGRDVERAAFLERARALGIESRLKLLGWVPEDQLPALYAEALCFVYPSEYEGFGLQLCEAMAVGCPVLAADRTSLPEVLGSGGVLFSLANVNGLASLLQRIVNEPDYRAELALRAGRRARDFTWEMAAAQTADVYQKVIR